MGTCQFSSESNEYSLLWYISTIFWDTSPLKKMLHKRLKGIWNQYFISLFPIYKVFDILYKWYLQVRNNNDLKVFYEYLWPHQEGIKIRKIASQETKTGVKPFQNLLIVSSRSSLPEFTCDGWISGVRLWRHVEVRIWLVKEGLAALGLMEDQTRAGTVHVISTSTGRPILHIKTERKIN